MIYRTPPTDFNLKFVVSKCFVWRGDHFLILLRNPQKEYPACWELPGGKLNSGERPIAAAVREVHEETGMLFREDNLCYLDTFYMRLDLFDFLQHFYSRFLVMCPKVVMNSDEHSAYRWVTISEALQMPLITHLDTCIHQCCSNQIPQL